MTGSQSLSAAQLETIHNEVNRLRGGTDPLRMVKVDGKWHRVGEPVQVVIHQSLQHGDGRKRVMVHRLYTDSHTFGLLRSGNFCPTQDTA